MIIIIVLDLGKFMYTAYIFARRISHGDSLEPPE